MEVSAEHLILRRRCPRRVLSDSRFHWTGHPVSHNEDFLVARGGECAVRWEAGSVSRRDRSGLVSEVEGGLLCCVLCMHDFGAPYCTVHGDLRLDESRLSF